MLNSISFPATWQVFLLCVLGWLAGSIGYVVAQDAAPAPAADAAPRGSIVEDRAARKLLEAGDARIDADETEKALEIWRSVIERYPRSKVRYEAHLRLGKYLLEKKRAFDEARGHFEAVADLENSDADQRAEATLKTGVCFYEGRHYGQCFKVLRQVIEEFPASGFVNEAYYTIGLGHFKLGHYSRAIEALEKVGTAFSGDDAQIEKVEAGKRLFVKVDDNDLAILEPGETVALVCRSGSGDEESLVCHPIGRQVRVVLGSIPTALGRPIPGNGVLEIRGGDSIEVNYTDSHTADRKFDQQRLRTVGVVGTALVGITDGSFENTIAGVVIGKQANLQVTDADFDRSDAADKVNAVAEIWRRKTDEEIEEEMATLAAGAATTTTEVKPEDLATDSEPKIERFRKIDEAAVTLAEVTVVKRAATSELASDSEASDEQPEAAAATDAEAVANSATPPATATAVVAPDNSIHSGLFRGTVALNDAAEPLAGDAILQTRPGDLLRLRYHDEISLERTPQDRVAEATCIEGNLGNVRVTKTEISDAELKIKTRLRTSDALTQIGNHYKEFGLVTKADAKYDEALEVAEQVLTEARQLGGSILEQAYVQLWRTYFAKEQFNLAVAMSQRLMREFPESTFVDEAMLQQAHAFRGQGNFGQAITLYSSVLRLNNSPLKGEAQFGVAETYEQMAKDARVDQSATMFERSFVEYRKVYEQFPDSGRVGDAVAKMANFYYQKEDYARAIDVFENVLSDYPDANFLDVILFNYGRCLFRLDRRRDAQRMFDQLINEFPESDLAPEAKRISEALAKASAKPASASADGEE